MTMQAETKERWIHLCSLAAEEKDPARLTRLVREICELLEAKQRRLEVKPSAPPQRASD